MDPGQLRPLTVGETLDAAIGILRRSAATMAKLVSVVVLPAVGVGVLVMLSMIPERDTSTHRAVIGGGLVVITVLALATQVFATAACTRAALEAYLGDPDTPMGWRRAGSRFGAVLAVTLIAGIGSVLGWAACYLPGLALMALWSCALPALLAENLGPIAALRRSQALVRRRFWATAATVAGAYLLFEAVLLGVIAMLVVVLVLLLEPSGPVAAIAILGVVWFAAALLTTPFTAAVSTVLYTDLRVRREGLDIQYLVLAMDGPDRAPGRASPTAVPAGRAAAVPSGAVTLPAGAAAGPGGPGTGASAPATTTAPWLRPDPSGSGG